MYNKTYNLYANSFYYNISSHSASLLRSCSLGCHAKLPPKKRLLTTEPHSFQNKPITASVSFSRTSSRQIRPLKLAQSENAFYLCIPSSEMPHFRPLFMDAEKYSDAWMSFVCCCSFQLEKSLWRRTISIFANKGTKKSSSFAGFNLLTSTASYECRSFLLFSICGKLSALDWRLHVQLDISRKYIFSH